MYKIYSTTFIFSLFFSCSVVIASTEIFVKDFANNTIQIDISDETTVMEIKKEIERKKYIPISEQRIIYRTKQLSDEQTMKQIDAIKGSTFHLVISLETARNLKYGEIYIPRLKDRRETLSGLMLPNNKTDIDDYFLDLQVFVMQLDGLFKYDLPAGFIMEVGSKLNTMIPNLLVKNFFEDPDYLITKAIKYLNKNLNINVEEKVFSWKNDQEKLKNYLLSRLAYNFVLFKILQDENIYSIDQRFFSYDHKQEFIRLYEEKNIRPTFAVFAEKFKAAHGE